MTVQDTLQALGITRNYRGCIRAITAIELAMENEDRLEAVTKEIYREVAKRCGCNWSAVERNIRTVVQRAWRINRPLLIRMAGYPLEVPPTASEFIAIVANYIQRTSPTQDDPAPADAAKVKVPR